MGSVSGELLPCGSQRPHTLDDLFVGHGEAVYRVCLAMLRDPSLAEDAVHDTLIKAWVGLDSFRGESSLRSWTLQIAHNVCVSIMRRRREVTFAPSELPERVDSGHHGDIERTIVNRFEVDRLWSALDETEPLTRAVVILREVEGLSYEEIAHVLGVSLPTVKTKLFRARRALSRQLGERS
jgi:RNA polymerase sigma-70 factor, ECF subfamily